MFLFSSGAIQPPVFNRTNLKVAESLRLACHKDDVRAWEYTDLECISHNFVQEKAKFKVYPKRQSAIG